ncbi:MAG: hypothetical protein ACREPE_02430 [Lysobacter sp.]
MYEHFMSRRWLLAALLSVAVTACMAAPGGTTDNGTPSPPPAADAAVDAPAKAQVGGIEGQGPFIQFIVKYRDTSPTFQNEGGVQARANASAANSGLTGADRQPLKLIWQRRLAVGADVLKAERPLDRAETWQLMQTFATDPEVEYIEIDGIVTHQNRIGT